MISVELFTPQNTSSTQGRFYLKKKKECEGEERKEGGAEKREGRRRDGGEMINIFLKCFNRSPMRQEGSAVPLLRSQWPPPGNVSSSFPKPPFSTLMTPMGKCSISRSLCAFWHAILSLELPFPW